MMGVQHYTESLGIVTQLYDINTLTRYMLEFLGRRPEYTIEFQKQFGLQQ